jgi:thioredoxin reductase (NADPH)
MRSSESWYWSKDPKIGNRLVNARVETLATKPMVRADSLATSMSTYLIREIDSAPNVAVHYGVEVIGGGGDGRLGNLQLRDRNSGDVRTEAADGLFILIGGHPFTRWLPKAVRCDEWGCIVSGPNLDVFGTNGRSSLLLETSMPGVFAVGDVRDGSVKRVASAVGEGSIAIRVVHEYLALTARG